MGRHVLSICGAAFALASALFAILSFSTPYWLESYKEANSRFDRLGLWEACFNNFGYDRDNLGKVYKGCGWIFSYDYRPIFDWLNPAWFLGVQVMMTLAMILTIVTSVLCILGLLNFCPPQRESTAQLTNSILMLKSMLLLAVSVATFGVKSDADRQWIPRPDQNFLSWSFGLAVVAAFFAIFSAMCLFIDSRRILQQQRKRSMPPPFSGYKMSSVPPQY